MLLTGVVLAGALYLINQRRQTLHRPPVFFTIPEFALTNQNSQRVTLADLRGHVWVADIIFTRCAGPCPLMTQRLSEIQAALPSDQAVKLVTLTTDAEYDTPAVLKKYGERYGAQFNRWWFLTGDPHAIANLAIDGFKFVAAKKQPEERTTPADLFVHSTYFVVVDQKGRARGVFEYNEPNMKKRLLQTIHALLQETS